MLLQFTNLPSVLWVRLAFFFHEFFLLFLCIKVIKNFRGDTSRKYVKAPTAENFSHGSNFLWLQCNQEFRLPKI